MLPLAQDLGLEAVMHHFHCILLAKAVPYHPDPNKEDIDMLLEEKSDKSVVFQLLSHVRIFATPWSAAHQASLSFTISWSLLKFMSTESVMPSNHLILCHPLLLLPSAFPRIRVFSSKLVLHIRWPKYLCFSFNISPSNEYSGLISFRVDRLDGSPCNPRDSQEFSPIPQFKSINSLVLGFLYSPTLTFMHDYWRNHIFD